MSLLLAEVTLTFGDFAAFGGMLTVLTGGLTTVMLFNFREQSERIKSVEDKQDQQQREKVNKEEWLRDSLSTRAKVDGVSEQIARLDAKMDAQLVYAAANNNHAEDSTESIHGA